MAIEQVREYFRKAGIEERIQEFEVSSATVELAAEALRCEPCRIAKSLSFLVDDTPVLVVTAGDVKIDNRKYKEQFGTKAKMLKPDEAPERIGHAVGGVCPFAVKDGVRFIWIVPYGDLILYFRHAGAAIVPLNCRYRKWSSIPDS